MAKQLIPGAVRGGHFKLDPFSVLIVGLDTDDGPEDPLWDGKRIHLPIDRGMVESIKKWGVIQPIGIAVDDEGTAYVTRGRQRIKHARVALEELRAVDKKAVLLVDSIVTRLGDGERHALMGVVENEHRRNTTIGEKAEVVRVMIARGHTVSDIALAFNVTAPTINQWLKFDDLPKALKSEVEAGRVSASAAVKLAELPKEEQKAKVAELIATAPAGRRVTVARASAAANPQASRAPGRKQLMRAVSALPDGHPFAQGILFALGKLPDEAIPDLVSAAL